MSGSLGDALNVKRFRDSARSAHRKPLSGLLRQPRQETGLLRSTRLLRLLSTSLVVPESHRNLLGGCDLVRPESPTTLLWTFAMRLWTLAIPPNMNQQVSSFIHWTVAIILIESTNIFF